MTRDVRTHLVRFGTREWTAFLSALALVLGSVWNLSARFESRFTRLETQVENLQSELRYLRTARAAADAAQPQRLAHPRPVAD